MAQLDRAPGPAAPGPERGAARPLARVAARGGAVTVLGQLLRIGVQVASVVLLARLLTPHDYGVVAMVLAVIGVGELLRDFGLSSAAIQAPELSRGQRSNLWWITTGLGLALTLATAAAAPLVARLYDEPALVPVVQVLAVTFLLNGFAGQFRASLVRGLRFTRLAALDVLAPVLGLGVAIGVALGPAADGGGHWALVAQQLTQALVLAVGLCAAARWWPSLPDRTAPVGGMLRFGGHLVATQVLGYVASNVDALVIGRRFGTTDLGLYNRGQQLVTTTLSQLRTPTTTVALPVLSRIQDQHDRFGAYVRRGQVVLGYTLVAGVALVVGATEPVVRLVLGAEWVSATTLLRLLAVAGAMQTLAYVGYWVYLARGLTADLLRYSAVTACLKVAGVLVGSAWGVEGVAAGIAVAATLEWPLSLWWLGRRTVLPTRALLAGAVRVLLVAAAAAAAAAGVTAAAGGSPATLAPAALAWAGTYAAAALVPAVRRDLRDVVDVVRTVLRRRGAR